MVGAFHVIFAVEASDLAQVELFRWQFEVETHGGDEPTEGTAMDFGLRLTGPVQAASISRTNHVTEAREPTGRGLDDDLETRDDSICT